MVAEATSKDDAPQVRPEPSFGFSVEGRPFLDILPARFGVLVLPVQDPSDLLLCPRRDLSWGLVPCPDALGVDEEALVPRLYRHPDGVALRPGGPHEGDAPRFGPWTNEEIHLGPFVGEVRDDLAEGDHSAADLLDALLHLPLPLAEVVALRDDGEVDVVDDGLLPPQAARQLAPRVEVASLLQKVRRDLPGELRFEVLLQGGDLLISPYLSQQALAGVLVVPDPQYESPA